MIGLNEEWAGSSLPALYYGKRADEWTADDVGGGEDAAEFGPEWVVAAVASMAPGPQLHSWLSMLDPAHMSEAQLLEAGAAWERQRRSDAAAEYALLARLQSLPIVLPERIEPNGDRCSKTMGPEQWASVVTSARADAYAAATAQATATVAGKAAAALQFAPDGPLAATGAQLRAGRLGERKALVIARELAEFSELDPEQAARIEAAVLPDADVLTAARLRRDLRRRIAAAEPRTEHEAHLEARARRCVSRPMPLSAGMAFLEVLGPAEDVHLLHTALTSAALRAQGIARDAARAALRRGDPDATQTLVQGIDAHRFDALMNLAAGLMHEPGLPTRKGRRPAIAITMAMSTLLGHDDDPADLEGYGPITADVARRAAQDPTGTWQRLITRPDGLVIDAAYTSYRPPQCLADTVVARDRTCTHPGCHAPARASDIDHQIPWPAGDTSYMNNHALCRRHHNCKTACLTTPRYDPDTGDTYWTDKYGRTTRRPAYRYPSPTVRSAASTAPAPASTPVVLPRLLRDRVPEPPSVPMAMAVAPDDDPPPF